MSEPVADYTTSDRLDHVQQIEALTEERDLLRQDRDEARNAARIILEDLRRSATREAFSMSYPHPSDYLETQAYLLAVVADLESEVSLLRQELRDRAEHSPRCERQRLARAGGAGIPVSGVCTCGLDELLNLR